MSTSPPTREPLNAEQLAMVEHLVNLKSNQDHIAQKWLEFLLAIEVALALALGYVLRPLDGDKNLDPLFSVIVVGLIGAMGILFAIFIVLIVMRERRWQVWYVDQVKVLNTNPQIYPDKPDIIDRLAVGHISTILWTIVLCIVGAWLLVMGVCFHQALTKDQGNDSSVQQQN